MKRIFARPRFEKTRRGKPNKNLGPVKLECVNISILNLLIRDHTAQTIRLNGWPNWHMSHNHSAAKFFSSTIYCKELWVCNTTINQKKSIYSLKHCILFHSACNHPLCPPGLRTLARQRIRSATIKSGHERNTYWSFSIIRFHLL